MKKTSPIVMLFYILVWPISLPIAIYRAVKNKEKEEAYTKEAYAKETDAYNSQLKIDDQYWPVMSQHLENTTNIGTLYTVANNLSDPASAQMDQVIQMCIEDIKLAPILKTYWEKSGYALSNYYTFSRLAKIYEKRKEYGKAIEVCQHAINLGYTQDGTEGNIPGRLARLIKKSKTVNKQIEA